MDALLLIWLVRVGLLRGAASVSLTSDLPAPAQTVPLPRLPFLFFISLVLETFKTQLQYLLPLEAFPGALLRGSCPSYKLPRCPNCLMLMNTSSYEGWAWWRAGCRRWEGAEGPASGGGPDFWAALDPLSPHQAHSLSPASALPLQAEEPALLHPWGRLGGKRRENQPCLLQPPHPAMLANLFSLLLVRASLSSLEPHI